MAYNTAPFHGKLARTEKNDVAMGFTEGWKIDGDVGYDDSTYQGDSWEDQVVSFGKWTAEFSGAFVAGNTEQKAIFDNIVTATPGTKLTDMKFLLESSTSAFTGDLHVLGLSVDASKAGKVKFTVKCKGAGALSLTDAA